MKEVSTVPLDLFGRQLHPGDVILYAALDHSGAPPLRLAIFEKFIADKSWFWLQITTNDKGILRMTQDSVKGGKLKVGRLRAHTFYDTDKVRIERVIKLWSPNDEEPTPYPHLVPKVGDIVELFFDADSEWSSDRAQPTGIVMREPEPGNFYYDVLWGSSSKVKSVHMLLIRVLSSTNQCVQDETTIGYNDGVGRNSSTNTGSNEEEETHGA